MAIDDARKDQSAVELYDDRVAVDQPIHLLVASNGNELVSADRDRLRPGLLSVDSVDPPAAEDQIG